MEILNISPIIIEYEIWLTGGYLETRHIKTHSCLADNIHGYSADDVQGH